MQIAVGINIDSKALRYSENDRQSFSCPVITIIFFLMLDGLVKALGGTIFTTDDFQA